MYLAKITKDNQLLDVKHYDYFENAVAELGELDMFDNLPEELCCTLGKPEIKYESESNGIADDFEFHYENGVVVYIGIVMTREEKGMY